jgi:UDP-N-acetylglucosamine--N-acetylmuramyl-(pentapeptide) pyrophosphoryl-undecaprenol N-acetylglucosamine transferase
MMPKPSPAHPSAARSGPHIVVAGGGTGGHLFPGIAIAEAFQAAEIGCRVLFVGTGRPLEAKVIPAAGFAHRTIRIEGIKGRGARGLAAALLKMPGALVQSLAILRRFDAHLVVGVGSYAAGPVILAARLLRTPVVLHEQNSVAGITNRLLAPFASRIYLSFETSRSSFAAHKTVVSGNPVRRSILAAAATGDPADAAAHPFTVLILGGSQGARSINEAVMGALDRFGKRGDLRFIHQTGAADEERVRAAYAAHGLVADVRAFITAMGRAYGQADLILCRAGATTVAEITALGKAAVLIPYPYAADNHQLLNARSLQRQGAAEVLLESDLNGSAVFAVIDRLRCRPRQLRDLGAAAARLGRPAAARAIVADCQRLLAPRRTGGRAGRTSVHTT